MEILDFCTAGGKDLIQEYIDLLPAKEQAAIYDIIFEIQKSGYDAFVKLNTRQLFDKLWEIKIHSNRIMYIIADKDYVYFLHICKKQKGKAEKHELATAIQRAKAEKLM